MKNGFWMTLFYKRRKVNSESIWTYADDCHVQIIPM